MTLSPPRTPALWSAQAHMPSVLGNQVEIVSGSGAYVTTSTGKRLLDATAGLWHANIGHGREEVAQAAYSQMARLETYHVFGRFANDRALALAERVAALAPFSDARVIFTSGGSDAVEVACKLARRHWQEQGRHDKKIILSRAESYHGLHAFGTSVAGIRTNREGYGAESLVPETARVHHSDIAAVEAELMRIGPENIAAMLAEPVMGTGGVFPPAPGYLEGLQRLATEHEILLIADEVITGFGRTGTMFACERYDFTPDMVLMAKGITSGYAALGGVLVAPSVWQAFYDGAEAPLYRHGLTYSGHATACAVAEANLDILQNERLVEAAGELEGVLDTALARARAHDRVVDVRIGGFLAGIQLEEQVDAHAVADHALDNGVITRVLQNHVLQISPPFVVTPQEVDTIVATLMSSVDAVAR